VDNYFGHGKDGIQLIKNRLALQKLIAVKAYQTNICHINDNTSYGRPQKNTENQYTIDALA